jgi:Cd2+/Zn2+-exporting ATPase
MDCAEEIALLKREVGPLAGGEAALSFDLLQAKMTVRLEGHPTSSDEIRKAVARTGMTAVPWSTTGGEKRGFWQTHGRSTLCALSGLLLTAGFGWHVLQEGWFAAVSGGEGVLAGYPLPTVALYLGATITGGWFVAPKAWLALRRVRPDMNLLMTIAVAGAIGIGEWFEAATVAFLFALALVLESWSIGRARHAIGQLLQLAPTTARYICPRDGDVMERAVAEVPVGATVIVRPGEKIPLDGTVTKGFTTVNEAPITGEAMPAEKNVGATVFAGTINNEGAFEFKATKAAEDTTLAHIVRMVEEAQARRAPSEQWVEKFARYYTPAMMLLATLVALIPPLLFGASWTAWFYQALVLLVIACPCALVISTPVTIVAGLASAARAGVLIKGGAYLEAPAHLRAIALDKTGTMTYGRPVVQRVVPLNGHSEAELLARAAALETHSEHPIAQAVLRKAQEKGIVFRPAENFQAIRGKGAEGLFEGRPFWLGSHRYVHEKGFNHPAFHEHATEWEDAGHSVVFVGNEDHVCGVLSVADNVRPETRQAIEEFKAAGIEHIVMLTGDNEGTARAVALAAGVDAFRAQLLPADKVAAVEELVATYGSVGMIGDGVNDAPAMAASRVGIAMGAAGSDAAIETADIALMADDLLKASWLIRHSRRTLRIIKQNIYLALGIKVLFVVLTILGAATLWMAIAADMGASLLVIFNGLRLLHSNETAGRVAST